MESWAYFFLVGVALVSATSETQEYLNRQRRDLKLQIGKSHSSDPPLATAKNYDVRWDPLWRTSVDSDHALTLSISNETFVLADDRVLRVELDVSDEVTLRQVASISQQKSAKFVKTLIWKGSLYLWICQEDGTCTLHVGPTVNELRHRQFVKHHGLPADAEFFTQGDQLYLVVAYNSGQFSVPSVIYHWTGTYMDVIAEVSTTGAVSVATLNQKHSTIVIFAQNVQNQPRIGSKVFEFKDGAVENIQFLPTDGPVSIHRYTCDGKMFLLIINERSASEVFWWDGKEFLNWMELPELKSPTKVNVLYVDGDTLLLVSDKNILTLYRILNLSYTKLNLLKKTDTYMIMDFDARVNGASIILVLVTKSEKNLCRVEPVELVVRKTTAVNPTEETHGTWEYLIHLNELLSARMPAIEAAHDSWPTLLSSSEDVVIASPQIFDDLVLDYGTVSELVISTPAEVLTPTELASGLEQLNLSADLLIARSSELIFPNGTTEIVGTVFVDGDAHLDQMHLDSLDVSMLNGHDVGFDGVLTYSNDQEFSDPLKGDNITVRNLQIDSLCGIPFKNWKTTSGTGQTTLNFFANDVKILNETILVESDLSLESLSVSRVNELDLQTFFNDLFIVGLNQKIKGDVFFQILYADHLRLNTTNGISADELLTKTTDQRLGDFSIKSLDVDELFVQSINNVSVDQAARVSQENIISGQVTIRDLRITEELVDEGVSVVFDLRPIQFYSTVKIDGDLLITDLASSSISLNGSKVDVNSLFENYWTKSSDQTILQDVTLTKGMTIDDLHADHLNGYGDEDFLYTTATEIPDKFGPLNFKRLQIDGLLKTEGRDAAVSVASEDTIVVNQRIEITDLRAVYLNTKTYNKIPITDIASGKIGVKIQGTVWYEKLSIQDRLTAEELKVKFLNDRELTSFFAEALRVDDNYELDYLVLDELKTTDFGVEELNGLKMEEFYRMLKYKDITGIRNVTIDGDLVVSGDLKVGSINGLDSLDYVEILSSEDIVLGGEDRVKKLVVFGNLEANLFHGVRIEDLVANTLSKSKNQRISGDYSFQKVKTDNLIAQQINGRNVTGLRLVTEPLIFEGDVTFSELLVEGDITTGYFNGEDIAEVYDGVLMVPLTGIKNLFVNGSMFWENSSKEPNSLSYMLGNAVTKNTNQTISTGVVFSECVCAFRLQYGENILGGVDIPGIVIDAIVPRGQATEIEGRKVLARGLTAGRFTVSGDIGIPDVNGVDILDLNSTIVRKFDTQAVHGPTIFRKDVKVERMNVTGNVHGRPTRGIATFNGRPHPTLPGNTRFMNLKIQQEIKINKLDGIDFDAFVKNRVTIDENHVINSDVAFRDPVVVTRNAVLSSINGIDLSDVVLSGSEQIQVISGQKIFQQGLTVHGNVKADLMNGIRISEEYRNGIFNNEDVQIVGNIIFSAELETLSNVTATGSVNGITNLSGFSRDKLIEASTMIANLERSQSSVDRMIDRSFSYTQSLPNVFFYLDEEEELVIRAPNISRVQEVKVESMTKLNLYGKEPGRSCGLPDHCYCPTQFVAEILDYECKIWKVPGSRIIYNIHDPKGRIGVNIVSNTTSYAPDCSQENPEAESTSIFWITPKELPNGVIYGQGSEESLEISGFLSDVTSFTIEDEGEGEEKLYIILAINYDVKTKSHDVNSLVYEIDLTSNKIRLSQRIRTSSAVGLYGFVTKLHGMHLLIACAGPDSGKSELHRFNRNTSKFESLRTFPTVGSLNAKSLIQEEDSFVLIDDQLTNCVHIYRYEIDLDNYYFYQSLYHKSSVKNIEVFYSGDFSDFGIGDAYVIVTTEEGRFFVYEYMFFGGFQLRTEEWLDGVQTMAHFRFSKRHYVFAGTLTNSTVYRIVEQGPITIRENYS